MALLLRKPVRGKRLKSISRFFKNTENREPALFWCLALARCCAGLLCGLFLHTVPSSPIHFQDVAAQSGIRAQMRCGGPEKIWIPEANGSGAAWLDYDRDGRMDLLIVNGSTMDDLRLIVAGKVPPAREGSLYLYRNIGDGRFQDVTERAGLSNPYWGTGVAVADFNDDGYPDILVTNIGLDLLFRNNGDGTFTEIGREAGLSRKIAWHTGAAFGDYDGDGKLDLYVAGYVDVNALDLCRRRRFAIIVEFPGSADRLGLKGEADILYHNEGAREIRRCDRKSRCEGQGALSWIRRSLR